VLTYEDCQAHRVDFLFTYPLIREAALVWLRGQDIRVLVHRRHRGRGWHAVPEIPGFILLNEMAVVVEVVSWH
jgi:hypothetical protein